MLSYIAFGKIVRRLTDLESIRPHNSRKSNKTAYRGIEINNENVEKYFETHQQNNTAEDDKINKKDSFKKYLESITKKISEELNEVIEKNNIPKFKVSFEPRSDL